MERRLLLAAIRLRACSGWRAAILQVIFDRNQIAQFCTQIRIFVPELSLPFRIRISAKPWVSAYDVRSDILSLSTWNISVFGTSVSLSGLKVSSGYTSETFRVLFKVGLDPERYYSIPRCRKISTEKPGAVRPKLRNPVPWGHNFPPENFSAFRILISALTDKFSSVFTTKVETTMGER